MIPVQNTVLSSTFDFWRNRTNEMANYFTTCAVTTDANSSTTPATGNGAITGAFTANVHISGNSSVNAVVNSTSIYITNSTVNTVLAIPLATQHGNNFHLAANGEWKYVSTTNGAFTATGQDTPQIDSYSMTNFNGAEYLVSIIDSTNAANFYTSKLLTTHDGNTAYITEYAVIKTFPDNQLGTFFVDTNSNQVRLFIDSVGTNLYAYVRWVRTII